MDLGARPVDLVLDGGRPGLLQGRGHVVGGLSQHGLEWTEQLETEALQSGGIAAQSFLRHRTQIATEHQRSSHQVGIDPGGGAHGVGHDPLERPLAQLSKEQPAQEVLFAFRRPLQQPGQHALFDALRAGSRGGGDGPEGGIDVGHGQLGACGGLGPHSSHGGVAEADAALGQSAREIGHHRRDVWAVGCRKELGDGRDLGLAGSGGSQPLPGLGDATEQHRVNLGSTAERRAVPIQPHRRWGPAGRGRRRTIMSKLRGRRRRS